MLSLHQRMVPGRDAMNFGGCGKRGSWCIEGWPCPPQQALEATAVVLQAVYELDCSGRADSDTVYGTLNFGPLDPGPYHHFRVEPNTKAGSGCLPVAFLGDEHVAIFMPGGEPWWCGRSGALAGITLRVLGELVARDHGPIWPSPGQASGPGEPWAPLIVDLRDILERVQVGKRPLPPARKKTTRRRRSHPDQMSLRL